MLCGMLLVLGDRLLLGDADDEKPRGPGEMKGGKTASYLYLQKVH